jgi:hypothetical protein
MRIASPRTRIFGFILVVGSGVGCAVGSGIDPRAFELAAEPRSPEPADGGGLVPSTPLPASTEDAGSSSARSRDAAADAPAVTSPDAAAGDAAVVDAAVVDASSPTADAGAPLPVQGELVISEVMYNPSGAEPATEWLEIHNPTSAPRGMSGLVLKDGASPANSHTVAEDVVVPAGAYVILAASKASATASGVPSAAIVYEYGTGAAGIQLGNSASGAVVLLRGATEIARARYGALGLGGAANGQSVQLSVLTYAAAGLAASWCKSGAAWAASSDQGTPGAAADCP